MSTVSPADSTIVAIRKKVRRLTASPSTSTLSQATIDEAINTFYTQDFISSIKLDQLRNRYEFFTSPNVDRYKLNVDAEMSVRDPVYIEGRQGIIYKSRDNFFRLYPRFPQKSIPATGNGTTTNFTFTIGNAPFLSQNVVIGTKDSAGNAIQVDDDGGNGGISGNLRLVVTNTATGDKTYTNVGTVNYATGAFNLTFPVAPGAGQQIEVWTSFYQPGYPQSVLYWNNEFTVRPVPDSVYKIEVETYQTPTQFIASSESPDVNQWWQYIAYGASLEILRDRGDTEGMAELMEGFKRQENLVLERQANAEIGIQTKTELNSSTPWMFYYGYGEFY